jgi:hypothetical protein
MLLLHLLLLIPLDPLLAALLFHATFGTRNPAAEADAWSTEQIKIAT